MSQGVLIEDVEERSPGFRSGIRPGDRIVSINGREVEDHLDVRFHAALGDVLLELERKGESIHITIPETSYPLQGLQMEEMRTKRCGCKCIFCFIDQLPPGVRPSLLVKDEDYRLSFFHGNYTTLSTLKDRDIRRIIEQRLSPLYVSVHAIQDRVRETLLGRKPKRPFVPTMERLLEAGIELWGQIVLCPGVNDGERLVETVEGLSRYHPGFRGVAVVPLGLSAHREPNALLRPVTGTVACEVLATVRSCQEELLGRIGTRFVFAADEFYLRAGAPLPSADEYEGYGMLEDGVGMVRDFLSLYEQGIAEVGGKGSPFRRLALVTGTLFAPVLAPLARRIERRFGTTIDLVPVRNRFLGETITVAGLLGGADVTGEAGLDRLHWVSGADGLIRLLAEGESEASGGGDYPPA